MENSAIENLKSNKPIYNNFDIRKNIPIDKRFIITSLTEIDQEIPLNRRYDGLVFFVETSNVSDGTDIISTGHLYCFESDLTKPIPLHELSLRYIIRQITINPEDYTNVNNLLNKTFAKPGSIVMIKPLDIAVIFDGNVWSYFAGNYSVTSDVVFNTIPLNLVNLGNLVISNGIDKIIKSDNTLSDVIIEVSELPLTPEKDRYYSVNGFLYYSLGGNIYSVSEKFYTKSNLVSGNNEITHTLNSTHIICLFRINVTEGFDDMNNKVIQLPYNIIDENTININSNLPLSGELFLIAKR